MHSQSPDNHSQFLYQVLTVFIYEGNMQHLKFSFKFAHLFYSLETADGIHSSSLKIGEQYNATSRFLDHTQQVILHSMYLSPLL